MELIDLVARKQHSPNADELWNYFAAVMAWVKAKFPHYRREMSAVQWGILYNRYKDDTRSPEELEQEVSKHMADDEVTKKSGIYEFMFDRNERHLNLRTFTATQIRTMYEQQGGLCACCHQPFPIERMQGDHIVPWSRGGKTTMDNLQVLCKDCNVRRGAP